MPVLPADCGRGPVGGVPSGHTVSPRNLVVRSVVDTQRVDPSVATGVELSKLVDQAAFDRRVWPWATSEATSNCVEHAYPVPGPDGVVEVSLLVEEDVVVVAVMDHGRWRAPPVQDGSRGRRTCLMNRITASLVIHPGTRGARICDVRIVRAANGAHGRVRSVSVPRLPTRRE